MSAIPSFCDISIIKGKQIIWTIDLSKKENGHEEPVQIPEPISKNLYQLAHNYINDVNSSLNTAPPPFPPLNTSNNVRKFVKKILKCKRIRLSELANQLQLKKSNLKTWLVKGENPEGDFTDYTQVLKEWADRFKGFLSQDEMYEVINHFNKSLRKNLIKACPENPAIASSQLIEAVVLDNRFPIKKIHTEQPNKQDPNTLNLIRIEISQDDIHINDSFLWDEHDTSPETLQKFAFSIIKDALEEQRLNPSQQIIQKLINDVVRQIQEQIEAMSNVKNQIEPLIGFNANSINYKQKEQIIRITLDIKDNALRIQDSFDWEIDPTINQPEVFAENYVKENRLPNNFTSIIASQIRQQIDEYLQKRMKHFSQLFDPKIVEVENTTNVEDKKKTNNKVKDKILFSLNEGLESFPVVPPFKDEFFLKNQELFALLNKNTELLSPIHKKIFLRQLSCAEANMVRPGAQDFRGPGYNPISSSLHKDNQHKKSQFPKHIQSTQKHSKGTKNQSSQPLSSSLSIGIPNGISVPGTKAFSPIAMSNSVNIGPNSGTGMAPSMIGMPMGTNTEMNTQFQGYMPFGQTSMGNMMPYPAQGNRQENMGNNPIYNIDANGFLKG